MSSILKRYAKNTRLMVTTHEATLIGVITEQDKYGIMVQTASDAVYVPYTSIVSVRIPNG